MFIQDLQLLIQIVQVIGYAVRNQNEGEDFVEILLQPGRYYQPTDAAKGNNEINAEYNAEMAVMKDRIQHMENMLLQQVNNKE